MINRKQIFFLLGLVLSANMVLAQSPKQEWRSVWFSTVWAIDWPRSSHTTESTQKADFDYYFKQFETLRLNSICFQVRSMCDAMYNSAYEPWCQWLTGTRGGVPTYDPLAYLIEQAHKRGMEVHAWINPYRFASNSTYKNNTATDYPTTHPDWVQHCEAAEIYLINPGNPEVRQRIVDVINDILDKYDVDGFIFDDYFYQSGYKDEFDDDFYAQNNPDGLSRGDWRRHQVNLMVQDVYNAIKARKPWCRFGIGPAGVAASDKNVASKYGIAPCPDGSDWQYSGIYSEPVQWYVDRSIDYMAPQVYWPRGDGGNDYAKITPWWYEVAHHFGRHCYVSQSLSGLTTTIKNKPIAKPTQSNFDAYEINGQIELNRTSAKEEAPGMTFFSARDFAENYFTKCVAQNVWTNPAKVPTMTWYAAPKQGLVDNIARAGQQLTWTYTADTVRYGVYAVKKANRNDADIISSSKYYLGMSYAKSYTLPDSITAADYTIAVTVIDRYGNEWAPRFMGESKGATVTPQLTFPANNGGMMLPNYLTWNAIAGAVGYTVQVATDVTMNHVLAQVQVADNRMNTAPYIDLNNLGTYYWRVCAHVANAESNWSSVWSYSAHPFAMFTPADGAENVSHTPTFTWEDAGPGATYIVQIATKSTFLSSEIMVSDTVSATTSLTLPNNTIGYGKTYYVRVLIEGTDIISPVVEFTTETATLEAPELTSPENEGILAYPTIRLVAEDIPNNGYKFELSTKDNFPTRGGVTKRQTTGIGVNYAEFADMADGVYYAHVAQAGSYEFGTTIKFTYTKTTGIEDVKVLDSRLPRKVMTAHGVMILREGRLYDLQGKMMK